MLKRVTLIVALFAFLAATIFTLSERQAASKSESHSGAMQALEWWSAPRAYPEVEISSDGYYRAHAYAAKQVSRLPQSFQSLSGWNFIGPTNLSGRMLCVEVNPLNVSTIYAGSASGGLWRSYTAGLGGDWERVRTGHPVLGVGAIAIHPADSNTIYIGTGEVYRYQGTHGGIAVRTTRGSYGMGILKTTDGGATWTKSLDWSYHQERGIQALRFNPVNPTTIWAATTEGVYKSTDAGGTWNNLLPYLMSQDVRIHPTDTNQVVISAGNFGVNPVIAKTTDGGAEWFTTTPTLFSGKAVLEQSAAEPDIVYASIADSTTQTGSLWKGYFFGHVWVQLSTLLNPFTVWGVQGWYSHIVAVHPTDPNRIIHAGATISRSTDGGKSFSELPFVNVFFDHHASAHDPVDPDILYIANDAGIYRSTDYGQSFLDVSDGLATGQFYSGFSNSTTDSMFAFGQAQDRGGYMFHGSPVWEPGGADEVGWTLIDPTNDTIVYGGRREGRGVRKSTDRGGSFNLPPSNYSGLASWNAPIAIDPSNPNVLYLGRSIFHRSTDAGATFGPISNLPDGNPGISIAISATQPQTLYIGTAPLIARSHLFKTTNGGLSWADVTGPLPDRYPLDIAVDPFDADRVIVGFGGFGTPHVFQSMNGGGSWTDISGVLPDIPVTALLIDPSLTDILYAATDIGVHISTDAGMNWHPFSDGFPEAVLVSDLSMSASNRALRASTHGNGVFERKIPLVVPSIELLAPSGGETWPYDSTAQISWSQTAVESVKITFSTDNGISWQPVVDNATGHPGEFAWTIPPVRTNAGKIRVSMAADTAVGDENTVTFNTTFDGVHFPMDSGWNLISVPVILPDWGVASNFSTAGSPVFGFAAGYTQTDTVARGAGYWIRYDDVEDVVLEGTLTDTDTIELIQGWNLVGSVSIDIPVAAVVESPPGLLETPFYAYDDGYSPVETITEGRGYWVKANAAGSIILRLDSNLTASPPKPNSGGTLPELILTDRGGRSGQLYFSTDSSPDGMRFKELPPVPPGGGFDLRFDNDRQFIQIGENQEEAIRVQGFSGPVEIAWRVLDQEMGYFLSIGPDQLIELVGSGSATISVLVNPRISATRRAPGSVPVALIVHQNYPNPFNPTTTIRYSLPSETRITIRVYDQLGQELETLLDEVQREGDRSISWAASDYPSGVYYYEIVTDERIAIAKMLLIK